MMQVLRLAAAGILAAALGCAPMRHAADASPEDVFPVGVSQIDITPDEPIRLAGYGSRTAPSEGIGQRLWAKAIAFGNDQRPAVLITADLVGVPRDMTEDVARRLQKRGLERAQLAVAVTHTHTGPSLAGVLPYIFGTPGTPIAAEQEAVIARYSRQLADKLEQAAIAALADRRPSRVAWAVGRVAFAANRRVLKDGKWTAFGIAPAGPVDHDLPLLAVRNADGSLRAVLVSYACHATTLEAKQNAVHGDWPGAAQALIQQRHPGAVAMVAIGAGADANPNPRGGGLQDVDRHAQEVAGEVDRLLATPLRPVTKSPVGRFRYVDLSFSRVPERGELTELARKTDTNGYYARSLLERLDRGERIPRTVAYPVQTWTYGDALAMVFLGGEVVADYGLRLKRELDGTRIWMNAYANDVAFYVASKRMIPEGGYEVDRSMVYYGQPGPLADSTEDLIVRTVRELLPAGFRQRAGR